MGFVEGIGSELFPVCPYLLKYLGIVTSLYPTLYELGLHGIDDVFLLLTHGLAQGVALASGEACELAAQEHDLLLIDGDAIGVLEVFFAVGEVVCDWLSTILASYERRYVVHWTRTIQGIHGDEVFEDRRSELLEVFLHTSTLELECTYGAPFLIELVCQLVVDGEFVRVYVYAVGFLDDTTCFLHLGEGLQTEEVHLDKTRRLDDVTIILRDSGLDVREIRIIGG